MEVQRAALAGTLTWLPAMENRGEGAFVSFDADRSAPSTPRTRPARAARCTAPPATAAC